MFKKHRQMVESKARKIMERENLDAIVALTAENFYYITGFPSYFLYSRRTVGAAFSVFFRDTKYKNIVIMNEFEASGIDLNDLGLDCEIRTFPIWVDVDDPFGIKENRYIKKRPTNFNLNILFKMLSDVLKEGDAEKGRIGMEISSIQHFAYSILKEELPDIEIVDSVPLFVEMRKIKSEWELSFLAKSVAIAEKGIVDAISGFTKGDTYAEIKARLQSSLCSDPLCTLPRLAMVGVGKDFAPRRYAPSTPTKSGDLIKIDVGVDVYGYGSDIARTFVVSEPSDVAKRTYEALRKGHDRLMELVGPGVSMSAMFGEVMEIIKKSGLPSYNRGHLGHSTGMTIEEAPFVGPDEPSILEPGMCVCLETPYYGFGLGSIMIENQIIITNDGIDCLNELSRDLIVI